MPHENQFPLLLNPDDFITPDYDIVGFERHVHQVKNFISSVARKEIKMLSKGASIDYETHGHQRMLVSNNVVMKASADRWFNGLEFLKRFKDLWPKEETSDEVETEAVVNYIHIPPPNWNATFIY